MAAATLMSVMPDMEPCSRRTGQEYLQWVSSFVSNYRGKKLSLKKPAGATLKICGLEDTIYRGRADLLKGWGQFYLPGVVAMQVVGVVVGSSCPAGELVLMTCEDKKLYGYDGEEELHVVAADLTQLVRGMNIDYPASECYYNGEAFKNMTEADWMKVKRGPVGRRLDEEHNHMVQQHKRSFMQKLMKLKHLS